MADVDGECSDHGVEEMDDEEMNHINATVTHLHPTPDEQIVKDIDDEPPGSVRSEFVDFTC
ncbi:hypothetical protein ARMGADRAFT_1082226 [Armillaria gallica]|uniref:Uncharacterized protein n=1 Tax=Armillaria gallica TaxID=47427 RepID=A0A2H3DHP9_ARMGA|nr:hypothetical protein ARMGADRAFT_1082226 [Armillaria gallica]